MPKVTGNKEEQLFAIKGALAYYSFTQSWFQVHDCKSKLLQITLEFKFACTRTKIGAITLNMYEPNASNVIWERLHLFQY
jgi:hypothetical protein